ncbi:Signal peptidase complex subunit 2 [Erysiphe necator]|nr:Signal peptidase complex subunit 2 [Erysiphe necator]
MSNDKISLYSLNDLKNSSDDALPVYLNSIKFRQSHRLSDIRLAIGYIAILISAVTFFWDYKFGFESTKVYTAIAVLIYTIFNGILTYWMSFVEKDIIYVGTNSQGDKIQISSKIDKHVPVYNLTVTTYLKSQPKRPNTQILKKPFNEWFNKAGYFVPLPFQQMLASNVPLIGAADPARVLSSTRKKDSGSKSTEELKNGDNKEKHLNRVSESSGIDIHQGSNVKALKTGKKKENKS